MFVLLRYLRHILLVQMRRVRAFRVRGALWGLIVVLDGLVRTIEGLRSKEFVRVIHSGLGLRLGLLWVLDLFVRMLGRAAQLELLAKFPVRIYRNHDLALK